MPLRLSSLSALVALTAAAFLGGCGGVRGVSQSAVTQIHHMDETTHALGSPASTIQTFWILDGISVINTQKTLDDHLVSWITGDDCSTLKALHGEEYCQPKPEKVPTITRISYCYKNLAGVTCYTDPLPGPTQPMGIRVDKIPVTAQVP